MNKMLDFLTREYCNDLVSKSEVFYKSETEVNGYKVEMYDYRLASYKDFKDNNAFELRGLTFIYDGSKWIRHLSLGKFFNVNENEDWTFDNLGDIDYIQNKEDGSLIVPIVFPNGDIILKSKMSFISEQAVAANKIFNEDLKLQSTIKGYLEKGLLPLMEYTSPFNQIVLKYNESKLRIIQLRDSNGDYYLPKDNFSTETFSYTKEELLYNKENLENIEGYVITFKNGLKAKIKTDWYVRLHRLCSSDAMQENNIIENILNNTIDDVISQLEDGEKKSFILSIIDKVQRNFNHLVIEYKELRRKYFQDFEEDKKSFAIKHSKDPLFPYVVKGLNYKFSEIEEIAEKSIKEYLSKKTKYLRDAKLYLDSMN